jgi:RNA polymerase sigma factor for flagellar operon FliA
MGSRFSLFTIDYMISMQGVPSVLIAKNQSWVRQQAQALARRLPANVERADLIQAGLIAVAQAAVTFRWPEDRDSPATHEEFVRYARMRVKGAMLDELRQMDFLSRGDRRKLKAIDIARDRFRSLHGREPGLVELAELTRLSAQHIGDLLRAAQLGRQHLQQAGSEDDDATRSALHTPTTEQDEVEARVDTAIVLRRLERFFAELPERDRLVIDAYLGVGLSPAELARSLNVTPSRVSQIYHAVVQRAANHIQNPEPTSAASGQRATDRLGRSLDELVALREQALRQGEQGAWGELIEHVLGPTEPPQESAPDVEQTGIIQVSASTRWG